MNSCVVALCVLFTRPVATSFIRAQLASLCFFPAPFCSTFASFFLSEVVGKEDNDKLYVKIVCVCVEVERIDLSLTI